MCWSRPASGCPRVLRGHKIAAAWSAGGGAQWARFLPSNTFSQIIALSPDDLPRRLRGWIGGRSCEGPFPWIPLFLASAARYQKTYDTKYTKKSIRHVKNIRKTGRAL